MINQLINCTRRKGRYITKIKHASVCAVISISEYVCKHRAKTLLGYPQFVAADWIRGE